MTLYSHTAGPNPWKVAIILEELGLPYEHKFLDFSQVKAEPFISLNPNGRVPGLEDPNTNISLWEVRKKNIHPLPSLKQNTTSLFQINTNVNLPPVRCHNRLHHRPLRHHPQALIRQHPREIPNPRLGTLPNVRTGPLLWPTHLVHEISPGKGGERSGPLRQRGSPRYGRY